MIACQMARLRREYTIWPACLVASADSSRAATRAGVGSSGVSCRPVGARGHIHAAIALDVGNQDPFVGTNTQLAESVTRLDAARTFEVYDGDHGNRIRERFESQAGDVRSPTR